MSVIKYHKGDRIAVICYSILAFVTELAIAHGDTTLYPMWLRYMYLYGILACLIVAIIALFPHLGKRLSGVCFLPLVFFSFTTFHSSIGVSGVEVFDIVYSSVRIGGFLCLAFSSQATVYEWFKRFLVIMSILGIVSFFSYVLSLPIPYRTVDYYVDDAYAQYVDYRFSILFKEFGAVRLCGLFNEPGAFGTILALVLCIERYDIKDKKNLILIVAAVLSFSVAFFAITAAHFLLRMVKSPKIILPVLIVSVIGVLFVVNVFSDNPIVSAFVNRFVFEDGAIDNRSNSVVDASFQEVIGGSKFLFGFGRGYLKSTGYIGTSSTIKTVFIEHGVLGFFITYGLLFLGALKKAKGNKAAINLIFCFFLSVYQRPNVYTLVYFVILFGGVHYIQEMERYSSE